METEIIYKIASTSEDFIQGRQLFEEYAQSLAVDLSFQDFSDELKTIDQQYNGPSGALVIAWHGQIAVGCCGIRKFAAEIAELKRMYVRTGYRNYHIGSRLLNHSLAIAKSLGYQKIRLDTLESMTNAKKLYASYGFREVAPYRFNPLAGTVYMEKDL